MPIHDWSRVDAGTFHDFHQDWTIEIRRALNAGVLPSGYFAMTDQRVRDPEPDVIALHLDASATEAPGANRIAIHHKLGRIVAMIEVVSPGNKDSKHALRLFVAKAAEFVERGIHLLIIDLFPPTARDPEGI